MKEQRVNIFESLRFRLIFIFAGLSIVPLIFVASIIVSNNFKTLEQESLQLQGEITFHVSRQIESLITNQVNQLLLLDDVSNLIALTQEEQQSTLSKLLLYQHDFHAMAILDIDGQEEFYISRTGEGSQNESLDWSQRAEYLIPINHGETYFGPFFFNAAIREPLMMVSIPLADLRSDSYVSVLVAALRIKPVWDLLDQIELPGPGDVYVIDKNGQVIAHRNPAVVLQNTFVDIPDGDDPITVGLSGEDVFVATSDFQFGEQKFTTVAEQPVRYVHQQPLKSTRIVVAATLVALIIGVLLASGIITQVVRPIEEVATSAEAMSNGDFSHTISVSSNDEVQQLALAFNEMSKRLQSLLSNLKSEIDTRRQAEQDLIQHRNSLEELVSQRTAELLESEVRFRTLVESMDDIIFTLDTSQRHIGLYGHWVERYGLSPNMFLGKTSSEILGDEAANVHIQANQRALKGKHTTYEWTTVNVNGEQEEIQTSLSPLRDLEGNVIGIVGVGRNVTDLKKAQKELEHSYQRLQELDQLKDDFINSISHEMRTPITNLKLYHHLMELKPENMLSYSKTVKEQTRRLEEIVEGILFMLQIQRELVSLTSLPVDLKHMIIQVIDSVKFEAETKSLELDFQANKDTDYTIYGDPSLLRQVVSILIDNAIKYADTDTLVTINLSAEQMDEQPWISFSVTNTGIGILPEERPFLFQRFFRGQAALKSITPGAGLGLAISKAVITQYQGRIELVEHDDAEGKTTFQVWLKQETG